MKHLSVELGDEGSTRKENKELIQSRLYSFKQTKKKKMETADCLMIKQIKGPWYKYMLRRA